MYIIFNFFVLIFGLVIGSFLNVIIYRLEHNETLSGRSYCPYCKHPLIWLDLFPIFSFLLLGGKCRYCKKKISWQYPLVEIATGLIFILILNSQFSIINQFSIFNYKNLIELCFLFYVASSMIIIFAYDLKHYIIPDKILFPAIIISFIYHFLNVFQNSKFTLSISPRLIEIGHILTFGNYIFAALFASGFFLLIYLVSYGEWMGFGDVKLAILLGLILGWPNIVLGIFLAFFFGAIISLGLMILAVKIEDRKSLEKPTKSKFLITLKSQIPFAPFLIMGTFVALFWGEKIIHWYIQLLS